MGCLEPPAERRPKAPWRCKHCLAHHTTKPTRKLDAAETVKKKYSKVWEKNRDVRSSKYVCDDILFLVNCDAMQIVCVILHILFRCALLGKEGQICVLFLQHLNFPASRTHSVMSDMGSAQHRWSEIYRGILQ